MFLGSIYHIQLAWSSFCEVLQFQFIDEPQGQLVLRHASRVIPYATLVLHIFEPILRLILELMKLIEDGLVLELISLFC